MQPAYEVADALRAHWSEVEQNPQINSWQLRTLSAIRRCRTADIGGHVDVCTQCGTISISYNSCRNRHCPKCQGNKREQWIQAREVELLPVPYFHVVFTLPDLLNPLAMHKPKEVYDTLFKTAWDTIKTFGKDAKHLGAKAGMISILHTWGQTLTLHPHLHGIIPGGGLNPQGKWTTARSKGKFLFPVKALSKVFRAKYVEKLKEKIPNLDKQLVNDLFKKNWVVYAKRPFGNPASVIEYLGRYTHKIAISNHRIKKVGNGKVTFSYKDYRHEAKQKEMTMDGMEFIRRFSLHILPKRFIRIRHYGILSSTSKKLSIPKIKKQLQVRWVLKIEVWKKQLFNPAFCPFCKTETMVTIERFTGRGPPVFVLKNK